MVGAGSITVQTRDLDEAIEAVSRVYSPHETAVTGRPTDLNVVLRVFGRTAQPLVSLSYGTEVSIDAGEFSNFIAMTKCARGSASALKQRDLPPLKWSSLKYVFRMEDKIDGKEAAYG